jgi:streptogramin lyase
LYVQRQRFFLFVAAVYCVSPAVLASDAIIETVAGTGRADDGGEGGPALQTSVGRPFALALGPDGGLYFVEYGTHRVRRLDLKSGMLTNVAGVGKTG